jgi:hypothetical protein
VATAPESLADLKTLTAIDKMRVEMDKMDAETRKILKEKLVIPFLAGAACMGALGAIAGANVAFFLELH